MANYDKIQLISYGTVTSTPTRVLDDAAQSNDFGGDATARAFTLCGVTEYIASQYAGSISDPKTLKVFVAPEFYFRFGGPSEPRSDILDSYPHGDVMLANIAEDILKPHFHDTTYSDWLIIAGSMFWHRSAKDSNTTHPTYFNTVLALKGGQDTRLSDTEAAANRMDNVAPTMGAMSTNQKAMMSNIDYAKDIDRGDWDAALNPMFRPILGDWPWWRWHMFHVHGVDNAAGKPLVFGLEVCLEHKASTALGTPDIGTLRVLRAKEPELPEIDVQIVTACGMDIHPTNGVATRLNGHVMLCDGQQPSGPKAAAWPRAKHERVVSISEDGTHRTEAAAEVKERIKLPSDLRIGQRDEHDPTDAVSIWTPAPLGV